jgi:hypothetical protein
MTQAWPYRGHRMRLDAHPLRSRGLLCSAPHVAGTGMVRLAPLTRFVRHQTRKTQAGRARTGRKKRRLPETRPLFLRLCNTWLTRRNHVLRVCTSAGNCPAPDDSFETFVCTSSDYGSASFGPSPFGSSQPMACSTHICRRGTIAHSANGSICSVPNNAGGDISASPVPAWVVLTWSL